MRYRLLASYQGAPFEAGVGPEETGLVLFAACPPPEDLGFEPATGHWRKQVDRADVQTLYESRPVGTFRGERCVVLDDLNDRLHIAYLGHDAYRAEQLGYWEVDRGVFELITPRQEVTEIVEQRLPVAAPGESASQPEPAAAPPGPPSGYGSEQANGSRPHLPPPDVLSGSERLAPGHQALDEYLQAFPQYSGSAGQGARRPDELGAAAAADVAVTAADEAPLPLEAQAMRAARKAKKGQDAEAAGRAPAASAEPAPHAGPQPGSRPVPSAPAGLSEPSSVLPSRADSAISVPSWSPQPHVPAQRPSGAEPTDIPDQRTRSGQGQAGEQPAQPPAARIAAPQPAAPQPVAPQAVVPQAVVPQAVVPQHVAPEPPVPQPVAAQPVAPQRAAPQPAAPRPGSMPPPTAAPAPVIDEAAIHGVPLPAPAGPAAQAPARQATASGAAAPYAAPVPNPPAAPTRPAASGQGQSPGVSLQRGAAAPPAQAEPAQGSPHAHRGPAPSGPAAPGAVPGSSSISNSPDGGNAQAAAHGPAAVGSLINGTYHGGQVTAGTSPGVPGRGLPRDQFERPHPSPAVAGPLPATSAYAGSAAAAAAVAGGTGQAAVGVAVADPVLTVPYPPAAPESRTEPPEAAEAGAQPASRRRRASRRRLPTQRIFSELAAQAGIPASAYAVNEDVDGAMCLVRTGDGFEVFNSLAGARHEVRVFQDEESAYFYLFGVLAAEAVRTGVLRPVQ